MARSTRHVVRCLAAALTLADGSGRPCRRTVSPRSATLTGSDHRSRRAALLRARRSRSRASRRAPNARSSARRPAISRCRIWTRGCTRVMVQLQGFADASRKVELLARQIVRADTELQIASATEQHRGHRRSAR